jgi:hypothetical protein
MPRHALPKTPKGFRQPGSGRQKGTPNPVSVEARQLVTEMVNNAAYQARLRRDFALRKLHPTIEALVWAYAIGKPRQDINLSGSVDVTAKWEAEKAILLQLDVAELEALQADSQALIDRARALAEARNGRELPQHLVVEVDVVETGAELLRKEAGSDNRGYGYLDAEPDQKPITPTDDGA